MAYPAAMGFAEILDELPRLTPEERHELVARALELGSDWIPGADSLSPVEQHLIEARLAEHDREPESAVPWGEAKARLQARFGV